MPDHYRIDDETHKGVFRYLTEELGKSSDYAHWLLGDVRRESEHLTLKRGELAMLVNTDQGHNRRRRRD